MARKIIRKKSKPYVKESVPKKSKGIPKELITTSSELLKIKGQMKLLKKREDDLKLKLGNMLEEYAYKDAKGSFITKVNIDGAEKIVKKEARKKPKLDLEKAETYFRKHKLWDFVSETKEIINESYVEQAFNQGKVPMKDLASITDMNLSYAIVLRDYNPAEDEEGII